MLSEKKPSERIVVNHEASRQVCVILDEHHAAIRALQSASQAAGDDRCACDYSSGDRCDVCDRSQLRDGAKAEAGEGDALEMLREIAERSWSGADQAALGRAVIAIEAERAATVPRASFDHALKAVRQSEDALIAEQLAHEETKEKLRASTGQADFAQDMCQQHVKTIATLTRERDEALEQVGDLSKAVIETRAERDRLQGELRERTLELDHLRSASDWASAYETERKGRERAELELEQFMSGLSPAMVQARNDQLNSELEQLQSALESANATAEELLRQRDEARESLRRERGYMTEGVTELAKVLPEKCDLRRELQVERESYKELHDEHRALRADRDRLQGELKEARLVLNHDGIGGDAATVPELIGMLIQYRDTRLERARSEHDKLTASLRAQSCDGLREALNASLKVWQSYTNDSMFSAAVICANLDRILSAHPAPSNGHRPVGPGEESGHIECPCCGDVAAEGVVRDGQELACGCSGHISCDGEDPEAWVSGQDDLCKKCHLPIDLNDKPNALPVTIGAHTMTVAEWEALAKERDEYKHACAVEKRDLSQQLTTLHRENESLRARIEKAVGLIQRRHAPFVVSTDEKGLLLAVLTTDTSDQPPGEGKVGPCACIPLVISPEGKCRRCHKQVVSARTVPAPSPVERVAMVPTMGAVDDDADRAVRKALDDRMGPTHRMVRASTVTDLVERVCGEGSNGHEG